MASARKLPSGNYRVNLFVGIESGKRKYKSFTAPTKKEAELMAAQFNLTRQEKPRVQMTVGEAIDHFLESKCNILSPSTLRSDKSRRYNNFKDIEHVKICDLKKDMIQSWINDLSSKLSPKSVKNTYSLLSEAVHECAKDLDISVKLPQQTKYIPYFPENEEIFQLLDYYKNKKDIQVAFMVAAVLGLRRGEICALKFDDIRGDKIVVERAFALGPDKQWHIKTPKSKAGTRELTIPEELKKNINELKKKDTKDGFIFHFNPNNLTDAFTAARNKIGFKFRLHDLRHYYASVMLFMGIPDRYAMQRMGHSTDAMLKRVYQHLIAEKTKEVDDSMTQYMNQFLKPGTMQHKMQHDDSKV